MISVQSLVDWWLGHPRSDWFLGFAVSFALTQISTGHPVAFLRDVSLTDRRVLHLALAGIAASLLGFFIATISILIGLLDSRRPRLRKALAGRNKERVQSFFMSGILVAGVALAGFLMLALVDDAAQVSSAVEVSALTLMLVLALATARIVWVLSKVVAIASKDEGSEQDED